MKKYVYRIVKHQKKRLFFPIFIAIILVSSILGFIWKGQEDTNLVEYKGYKFTKVEGRWVTQIEKRQIFFDYNPVEIENIIIPPLKNGKSKVYIAFDPEQRDEDVDYILQKIISSLQDAGIRPVLACFKDSPECPDIPIVTCKNNNLVIQILKANEANVFQQDNCIVLKGDITYLNKGIDKLRLDLLVA